MKKVLYNPFIESQLHDSNYVNCIMEGFINHSVDEIYVSVKHYFHIAMFLSKFHGFDVEFYTISQDDFNTRKRIFVDDFGYVINESDVPDFSMMDEITKWRVGKL